MIKNFMRIVALNMVLICSLANANTQTIYVKKFATSPDKQLLLYRETDCENKNTCQIFYQVNKGKIQKVADLEVFISGLPKVTWHNNLAELTTLSGTDTTVSTFIEAKRGVYQVGNMAHFDPTHKCLLASDDKGKGLAFFRLFDNQPSQQLDLIGLNVDKDWAFPINSMLIGGESKFLPNGDFQFDYFDKNNQRKLTVIHNPCNNK